MHEAVRFPTAVTASSLGLPAWTVYPISWLSKARGAEARELHLAFGATSRAEVDAVHDAAVAAGAEVLHKPRVWPEYPPRLLRRLPARSRRSQRGGRPSRPAVNTDDLNAATPSGGQGAPRAAPGAVLGISQGNDTHIEAVGSATLDGRTPLSADALFRISSMTKPLVAASAMMLVEDGVFRLEDPVERWLPELADRRVLRSLGGTDTVPATPDHRRRRPDHADGLRFRPRPTLSDPGTGRAGRPRHRAARTRRTR